MDTVERILPLFPLERVVLFPGMLLPLHIFEERYRTMIGTCQVTDKLFGVLLIRSGREVGEPAQPVEVGCTARIVDVERLPDGRMNILTIGEERFRLLSSPAVASERYLQARVRVYASESGEASTDHDQRHGTPDLVDDVAKWFADYLQVLRKATRESEDSQSPDLPSDPAELSFRIGGVLRVAASERQKLLEIDDVEERLRFEQKLLRRENQQLRLALSATGANKTAGPFSLN